LQDVPYAPTIHEVWWTIWGGPFRAPCALGSSARTTEGGACLLILHITDHRPFFLAGKGGSTAIVAGGKKMLMPPKKAALKATSSATIVKPRMYLGGDPLHNSAVRKGRSLAYQVDPKLGVSPAGEREVSVSIAPCQKDLYPLVPHRR
jgi:hypothetical protein